MKAAGSKVPRELLEVVTGRGFGRTGWWYYAGDLAARNAAAARVGSRGRYVPTGRRVPHPVWGGSSAEWRWDPTSTAALS